VRRIWRHHGLSIVLVLLFVVTLGGQIVSGHKAYNTGQRDHAQPEIGLGAYLQTPAFLEATAENWESEFLQMALYVMLTTVLYQRGSAESKDPDEPAPQDREPDASRPDAPWPVKRGGLALAVYRRSLSLAFVLLFAASVVAHAVGGAGAYNEEAAEHADAERVSWVGYMGTSRFWFESLQNWQSEFLAMLSIVVLTIWLRQHGSPESKPVDASHGETGNG
jgi:hypothetical protein